PFAARGQAADFQKVAHLARGEHARWPKRHLKTSHSPSGTSHPSGYGSCVSVRRPRSAGAPASCSATVRRSRYPRRRPTRECSEAQRRQDCGNAPAKPLRGAEGRRRVRRRAERTGDTLSATLTADQIGRVADRLVEIGLLLRKVTPDEL